MKNYLYEYIHMVDDILDHNKEKNRKDLKKEHLIKIQFFQHERLIHLLVTLFYALFLLLFVFLMTIFRPFLFIVIILITFLIFYVIHYFRLENGVQYLYKQYDRMCDRKDIDTKEK